MLILTKSKWQEKSKQIGLIGHIGLIGNTGLFEQIRQIGQIGQIEQIGHEIEQIGLLERLI